ncbi:hypothetical protein [Paenibacillus whitsoniae]|nr:hypothetical protein [Paenibacillus whitsoniae]
MRGTGVLEPPAGCRRFFWHSGRRILKRPGRSRAHALWEATALWAEVDGG